MIEDRHVAQAERVDPVRGVKGGDGGVLPWRRGQIEKAGSQEDHREEREQGGQQSERAAGVEGAEVNRAGALPLLQEQRGDQEAAQDEEEVDA